MRWVKKYIGMGTIGAETRWLETVYLAQRYELFPNDLISKRWVTEYFVERDEYDRFKENAKN